MREPADNCFDTSRGVGLSPSGSRRHAYTSNETRMEGVALVRILLEVHRPWDRIMTVEWRR